MQALQCVGLATQSACTGKACTGKALLLYLRYEVETLHPRDVHNLLYTSHVSTVQQGWHGAGIKYTQVIRSWCSQGCSAAAFCTLTAPCSPDCRIAGAPICASALVGALCLGTTLAWSCLVSCSLVPPCCAGAVLTALCCEGACTGCAGGLSLEAGGSGGTGSGFRRSQPFTWPP